MHPHRRFIASTVALLLGTMAAHGQAQSLSFGLMAGASLSTFTGDLAVDVKNNATFIAGGFVHASFAGFAVEPGLFYTQKGSKSGTDGVPETTQKLNYIQVPLVMRFGLPLGKMRLYVGAGPAVGVNIGCSFVAHTIEGDPTTTTDCEDAGAGLGAAKSTEISAIGVAGLDFGKLSLGLRYDGGLTRAFTSVDDAVNNPDLKTRTISAVASIRF